MNSVSLGTLSDVISYALDLDLLSKQALLAESNVDRRTKMLLKHLQVAAEPCGRATFPQIFVGERHIGGCDEMVALDRAGKLDPLLQAA